MKDVWDGYGWQYGRQLEMGWNDVKSRSCFIVGDDKKVEFWKNRWCDHRTLEEAFTVIFSMSITKDVWVTEM